LPPKRSKADVAATKAPAGPKKRGGSANTVKVNNDQVADSRVQNYHTYTYHVLDMVCVDTIYVDTVYVSVVIMYMPFKVQSPPDSFGAALRPIYQMGRMCCISELPVSRHIDSGRVVKPVKVQVPISAEGAKPVIQTPASKHKSTKEILKALIFRRQQLFNLNSKYFSSSRPATA
jgi:hypothetical protein